VADSTAAEIGYGYVKSAGVLLLLGVGLLVVLVLAELRPYG
jgi:hypothetical protein